MTESAQRNQEREIKMEDNEISTWVVRKRQLKRRQNHRVVVLTNSQIPVREVQEKNFSMLQV
jgi:hypothetical protein